MRAGLMAALLTGGILLAPSAAEAKPTAPKSCLNGKTGPACKDSVATNCNANNPNGKGCPKSGSNGPVCGNGRHVGNPHCRTVTVTPPGTPPGGVLGGTTTKGTTTAKVRAAQLARTRAAAVPRSNRSAAPVAGRAVSTAAGSAL
ncbi:MAG: hypothetical protein ABIS47_04380 [Acidimicrobiales bacterium]